MNITEHLLVIAMEETAEVQQRISKAIRFGLSEVQEGQSLNNAQRIMYELTDLLNNTPALRSLHRLGAVFNPGI